MTGNPLSSVIGGPISGFILDTLDGSMGLGGWQWLFIIEGVPSVLLGLWALRHLTDKPIEAAWLEPDERIALQARIDRERKSREMIRHYKLREALTNPRVLGLGLVYFGIVSGNYGLVYWLPQIVKDVAADIGLDKVTGVPINALTGYLVAVPFAFATAAMIWWARHPDAAQERVGHVVCPARRRWLFADSCRLSWQSHSCGCRSHHQRDGDICGPAHILDAPDRLSHRLRFRGIALINSIGNLGGFAGPYAIGWIKDATGETTLGLAVLAAGPIMAAGGLALYRRFLVN